MFVNLSPLDGLSMRFPDLVHLHSGSDLTTYEIKTVFRQFCEAVLFIVFYVFFSIILMDICLSSYSMCIYVSIVVLILACPTVWFKKEQYHINILCDTVLIKKLFDIGFVLRHYCSFLFNIWTHLLCQFYKLCHSRAFWCHAFKTIPKHNLYLCGSFRTEVLRIYRLFFHIFRQFHMNPFKAYQLIA